jgi:hypothetical protein
MKDMKMKTIFNQRMCGYLQMKGFILVDMRPNDNGSGKNVFYFKETPELLSSMQKYLEIRNDDVNKLVKVTL